MTDSSRISRATYQRALGDAARLVRQADTNADGLVSHVELLQSPTWRVATPAARQAMESVFLVASALGPTPGATADKLDTAVSRLGGDAFVKTFDRAGDGFSAGDIRALKRAGIGRGFNAGHAGAAVLVWARERSTSR